MYPKTGRRPASQQPQKKKDKLTGTRFSKTKTGRTPWRPNNPAKRGYNKTLNKNRYYHTGLYYKEKELKKIHDEKVWM